MSLAHESEKIYRSPVPHSTEPFALQDSVVYGPIPSRRLGNSLGINPLPLSYKFCDFDCVYCQYGWTPEKGNGERLKRAPDLLKEIEKALMYFKNQGTSIQCLTIAGNGEPTLHPDFLELIKGLRRLREHYYPDVRIGVLTDSAQIHRPPIREALELLDDRYMKLDAGGADLIQAINKPRGDFDFERMLHELETLEDIVIQSLFIEGSYSNTNSKSLSEWAACIRRIQPKEVQVYTLDRHPADPGLKKVSPAKLREIAQFCQSETGISAIVYD